MEPYPSFFVEAASLRGVYDDTAADVRAIIRLLRREGAQRILDLPCGFGRIAGPLHEAGFDIVGIDASEDQVALARTRNPGPDYRIGDMRLPPAGPFDVLLNIYTSFGYMPDTETDRACLRAWRDCLRPGALLVIETLDTVRVAAIDERERHLQRDDGVFVRVTGPLTEYISTDWSTNVMTIDYRIGEKRFVSRTRLYHRDEIARMLREEGFSDVRIYRDLDLQAVGPDSHTVFLARA